MRQIVAAAALAAALLAPVASADWVEVRRAGSVEVEGPAPSWEDGGAVPVPSPTLVEHWYCVRPPREDVCVQGYRAVGGGRTWVATPGVVWRTYEVPLYEASVWSPIALRATCGEREDGERELTLEGGLDATGSHEYAYRSTTLVMPPLQQLVHTFDFACREASGSGVPEQVLP